MALSQASPVHKEEMKMKHYETPNAILILSQTEDILTASAFGSKGSGFGERVDISAYFD